MAGHVERGSAGSNDVHGVKQGRFTVTKLHRSGAEPHRLLVVGSQSVLAPSRVVQAEALGERIADRVWLRTRRGVDLDMLWELRPVLLAIREGLAAWRLWRYDAVVVVSAARPSGLLARFRARGVQSLLSRVVREVSTASHVLVVSLADSDESRRRPRPLLGSADADADAGGSSRVSALSTTLDPKTGADAVAQRLMAPLAAADAGGRDGTDAAHRRRQRPDDEEGRQEAVDRLGLRGRRVNRRLQRVVDMARDAFETASAEITIIDHDRQWTLAAAGQRRPDQDRRTSLCNRSIGRPAPTVIGDTWSVPALRGNPLVAGADPIRFYAAHPIESIDGYRIGVLCIWDGTPHAVDDLDLSALRDLALLAEAEIVSAQSSD